MSQFNHAISNDLIDLFADFFLPVRVQYHGRDEQGSRASNGVHTDGAKHTDCAFCLFLALKHRAFCFPAGFHLKARPVPNTFCSAQTTWSTAGPPFPDELELLSCPAQATQGGAE
jgi:hypothetical protein